MALLIAKVAVVLGVLLTCVAYIVWVERKIVARIQVRVGPNRVGLGILSTLPFVGPKLGFTKKWSIFGLGQPIADGIKLFLKEDVEPAGVDRWTYRLAPLLALLPVFIGFSVIPFGPDIEIMGRSVRQQITSLRVDLLFLLAVGSLGGYGVMLAGWSSNSKYSLLGSLRAAAQVVSYELPLGLSLLSVAMLSGSLTLGGIIEAQSWWNVCLLPIAFVIAVICTIAESNRSPFDLPEAESELVAGFFTEYSGMRFALFFLGEYSHMFLGGSILAVAFLGGWHVPFLAPESTPWWLGTASFAVKVLAYMFLCMWLRSTMPRLRYDQLMAFSWKWLTPLAILNLILAALLYGGRA